MYVSDSHRAAFIHIPKTGGTAIREGLLSQLDCRRVGHKHGPVHDLPPECAGWFVFAMVRDPYRRLASQYRFRRLRDQKNGLFARTFPTLHHYLASPAHPARQCDYVDGRVTIFRLEDGLESALAAICVRLGIAPPQLPDGPAANRFGPYRWQDEMTRTALEIINDECRDDFAAFGYERLSWQDLCRLG